MNTTRYLSEITTLRRYNYSFGLKRSDSGRPVFISRGIGWAVYPVRFNCYPEIAVLTLTKGKDEAV